MTLVDIYDWHARESAAMDRAYENWLKHIAVVIMQECRDTALDDVVVMRWADDGGAG